MCLFTIVQLRAVSLLRSGARLGLTGQRSVGSISALASGVLGSDLPRQDCGRSARFCASLLLPSENSGSRLAPFSPSD